MLLDSFQILFISNGSAHAQTVRLMLEAAEEPAFAVQSKENARTTFLQLGRESADAALWDLTSDDKDAFVLLKELTSCQVPVLVLVSKNQAHLGKQALELGAAASVFGETLTKEFM